MDSSRQLPTDLTSPYFGRNYGMSVAAGRLRLGARRPVVQCIICPVGVSKVDVAAQRARITRPNRCTLTGRSQVPISRPVLGTRVAVPLVSAVARLLAARCVSDCAARTASCIVSSGVPRCIDSTRHSRAVAFVGVTTIAMLLDRPRVRPTWSPAARDAPWGDPRTRHRLAVSR